jgi:plastocyanin
MRNVVLSLSLVVFIWTGVVSCAPSSTASATPTLAVTITQLPATPTPDLPLPPPSPIATLAASLTPTAVPVPVVTVPPDPASPRGTLTLASFSFSPSLVTAHVGQPIRLTLENGDNIFHQFAIDNSDIDVQVSPGMSQKVDIVFSKPGTYVFACNLTEEGNHRGSGMVGKIVVEP